jgi:hypothetical protein
MPRRVRSCGAYRSDAPALAAVTVVVSDGVLETEQAFELVVEGGAPSGVGGASGSGGAGAGGDGGSAGGSDGGGDVAAVGAAEGCGCAAIGSRGVRESSWIGAAAMIALLGLIVRRRGDARLGSAP